MPICQIPDCTEHYGCKLRAKGVQIAPTALPSRMNKVSPRRADPTWERTKVTQKRPGGTEMPILTETGKPLRVKEYGERRREITSKLRSLHN